MPVHVSIENASPFMLLKTLFIFQPGIKEAAPVKPARPFLQVKKSTDQ